MPVAAGTPTVVVDSFNIFEAIVPLTLSGSYPGTVAGDPLDLSKIGIPSNSVPLFVDIKEAPPAGTLPSGVTWNFAPGTTQANGALQALVGGAAVSDPQANLGNVTYASVTAANLVARVVYRKFL